MASGINAALLQRESTMRPGVLPSHLPREFTDGHSERGNGFDMDEKKRVLSAMHHSTHRYHWEKTP